ncbi:MAG: hypothetical protein IKM11_04150, partial [Oscillospiraceae bacterium]|nr:hypothetical protein [Oscillospiraceae bacterium]
CASLLERSYNSVEPYTDRYWDSGEEDTLKAESYQDLVNSLLLLIEQRSEEVVIRYYANEGTDTYAQAVNAKHEVQNETLLGSYLLDSLTLAYTSNNGYCTLTYSMSYRTDAQDISTLMALSDSQSLVDLLRVALREGHESVTAQFISKLSCEEVSNAVIALWQELYLEELEASGFFDPPPVDNDTPHENDSDTPDHSDNTDIPDGETEDDPADPPTDPENGETDPESIPGEGEDDDTPPDPAPEPVIIFPPVRGRSSSIPTRTLLRSLRSF